MLLTALAYLTWFERKVVAHIQSRWGPYRVGPHGLMQPLADGVKFLFKEDVTPAGADKFVYFLAPFLALSLAITSIAVIPFGPEGIDDFRPADADWRITNLNIGLLDFVRDHLDGRVRRGAGRLVVQQQISAARRPAQFGANGQLRARADHVRRGRDPDGRHIQSERNRDRRSRDSIGDSCRDGT